jgi:hypothetical protein
MAKFKAGQRFGIPGCPFHAFFETTEDIEEEDLYVEGQIVIILPAYTVSVKVDNGPEEVVLTIQRPRDKKPVELKWTVDIENIEELEDFTLYYENIRFQLSDQ